MYLQSQTENTMNVDGGSHIFWRQDILSNSGNVSNKWVFLTIVKTKTKILKHVAYYRKVVFVL